jgi:hypothetical protein
MTVEKAAFRASDVLQRRSFLTRAGMFGLGATAAAFLPGMPVRAQDTSCSTETNKDNLSNDSPVEIFTAALIAEDLATTFYYNALVGTVITDPNLAGPGGTATNVGSGGNLGNVDYFRAALSQEIAHANLLRSLIHGTEPSGDPVQTFYLPAGAFTDITTFTTVLDALESAFIGAYLMATIEFAQMAADVRARTCDQATYIIEGRQFEYYAQVAASIMGVEAEHRVLGRVVSNTNPANNLTYEQTDGLTSVYNGKSSAVVALTPFLGPGTGLSPYSFADALANSGSVTLPSTGNPPAPPAYS